MLSLPSYGPRPVRNPILIQMCLTCILPCVIGKQIFAPSIMGIYTMRVDIFAHDSDFFSDAFFGSGEFDVKVLSAVLQY